MFDAVLVTPKPEAGSQKPTYFRKSCLRACLHEEGRKNGVSKERKILQHGLGRARRCECDVMRLGWVRNARCDLTWKRVFFGGEARCG